MTGDETVIEETINANTYYGEVSIDWDAFDDAADEPIGTVRVSVDLLRNLVEQMYLSSGTCNSVRVTATEDMPIVFTLESGEEFAVAPRYGDEKDTESQ